MVMDGAALDAALHGVDDGDPRAYLARLGYEAPPLDAVANVMPLDVEVNHGIWVWRCPCGLGGVDDPPSGGGVAFVSTPLGWCPRCQNAEVGGDWRPLHFPNEREAIEAVLALRPDPTTRNCWPGETVAELERENAEHGVSA